MSEDPTKYNVGPLPEAVFIQDLPPVFDKGITHPISTAGMAHKLQGGETHQVIAVATGSEAADLVLLIQGALEEVPATAAQFERVAKFITDSLKINEKFEADRYQSLDKTPAEQTIETLAAGYEASVRHEQLRRDRIRASVPGHPGYGSAGSGIAADGPDPGTVRRDNDSETV